MENIEASQNLKTEVQKKEEDENKQQCKQFACVVQEGKKFIDLTQLEQLYCNYYAIRHNRDYTDLGEIKTPHCHIVLSFPDRKRPKQVVKLLSKIFDTEENAISVRKVNDFKACLRYLCHLDSPTKAKYEIDEVLTNADRSDFEKLTQKRLLVDFDDSMLFEMCVEANSLSEIVRKIGFAKFSAFAHAIKAVFDEFHDKKKM